MKKDEVKAFFKERLPEIGPFLFSSMAGEHSVFSGEHSFAMVDRDDHIYFFTNDATRKKYIEQGMKPWGTSTVLYQVPPEIVNDSPKFLEWAIEAISALNGEDYTKKAAAKA